MAAGVAMEAGATADKVVASEVVRGVVKVAAG